MDDLIFRSDAIKALKESLSMLSIMAEPIDDKIVESIAKLPSAQQWIPCSERMPAPFKAVLVYTLSDDGDHCFMTTASHEGGKYWYDECFYQRLNEVYAWMQLPKPYEAEQ